MAYEGLEFLTHKLPTPLQAVARLATNLRWVWNHATDRVWEALAPEVWQQTRNPILVIQNTARTRLEELARNREFVERVQLLDHNLSDYLARPRHRASAGNSPRDRTVRPP